MFFENRLFLWCSFAENSQAKGCIFVLILSSNNERERHEVTRDGSTGLLYTNSNNQREAYSSVVVMDWEENGIDGNVTLNVTSGVKRVTSLAEYSKLTGFKEGTVCTTTLNVLNGCCSGYIYIYIFFF